MNTFQARGFREGEETLTSMEIDLFHTCQARLEYDFTASRFVISQAALLAHGELVLLALARGGRMRRKDWLLEHRRRVNFKYAPELCRTDQ